MPSRLFFILSLFCLVSCLPTGPNPDDPYEPVNREIHKFNMAFDATMLQPPAKLYRKVLPKPVQIGVNNFYNNINTIPTICNDLLQGMWVQAYKDTWRLFINTTLGIGGIFDAASKCQLPPTYNDLGITFAKWGDKESPYIVIPFLGPSTIRDGVSMIFDYTFFMPYPYLRFDPVIYTLLGIRYVDVRAALLEQDPLLAEAMDKYTLIRDAYLQHRRYQISGEHPEAAGELYVDEAEDNPLTPLPSS